MLRFNYFNEHETHDDNGEASGRFVAMVQMKRKFAKLNSALYIRCNDTRRKNGDRIEHFGESFGMTRQEKQKLEFNLVEKFSHLNNPNEICLFLDQLFNHRHLSM